MNIDVEPIPVNPRPCESCPYRQDCPSGVWDASEYEKLRKFDTSFETGIFLCHQSTAKGSNLLCRGWLSVHRDSIAVRLGVIRGRIDPKEPYRDPQVALYSNGNEAADAGIKRIANPGKKSRQMIQKLVAKGIGRLP